MDPIYHEAVLDAQVIAAVERIRREGWDEVAVERDGDLVFIHLRGTHEDEHYLARLDAVGYPVEPCSVGFVNPAFTAEERRRASGFDPRFWPHSPIPGLTGNFNTIYRGPLTVFWCFPCTAEYFVYHGDQAAWRPVDWPLERLVAYLRSMVRQAIHPLRWRPIQQQVLLGIAGSLNVGLPEGAGLGDA